MIQDLITEYLDAFKMRQDHLADVMRDGHHATGGDVSASEDVIYRKDPPPYIVDDGDISYLVVDDKSCHRLEPFFELSEECVNLGVNTHQSFLVAGTGAVETMMVRLIPANTDYQFTFIEPQDIETLIAPRLVSCIQTYMDDMIEYIGPFTEYALYRLMPSMNAAIRGTAEKLDVSIETIMSTGTMPVIVKIVNEQIVKAAAIYTWLVANACLKQVCETDWISTVIDADAIDVEDLDEDVDETIETIRALSVDVVAGSSGSDIRIGADRSEWKKVEPFGEWPDGDVDSLLALAVSMTLKESLESITNSIEEGLLNSLLIWTRSTRNVTEGSETTEDELTQSSFMRVVITLEMRILVGLATEEAIKQFEEESTDEDDT
jgi:hypothetical protein